MKLATYIFDRREQIGILINEKYYNISDLCENAPSTMTEFIESYSDSINFTEIIERKNIKGINKSDVKLLAPIPIPMRNVICIGKNYADHAKEVTETILSMQDENMIPSAPVYFTKNANPAYACGEMIPLHENITKKVDYEVELAVVIGKKASKIDLDNAEEYIFGYTIINDVTARELQTKYGQWYVGKSLDGFCPMGPCILTKDEMPFPIGVEVSTRVNGKIRQRSNTSEFIFDIPRIISELSQGITLYPGDIIATGTPAGIGHAMKPPVYLKSGDCVECEIEGIGVLSNIFK